RVEDGSAVADPGRDLAKLAVFERHRATGRVGLGFVSGLGLALRGLLGEAQALAAVREVDAHGGACRIGVAARNGGVDFLVLAVHAAQVLAAAVGVAYGIDPRARDDGCAQVAHDVREVAVARGLGDLQVKAEVGSDGVAGRGHVALEFIERGAHGLQVGLVAAQCRKTGGFGLQADAQLEHGEHVHGGRKVGAVEPEHGGGARREHEGAHAMVGLHEARGLELGQGLAHHGAAHTELGHDRGLGGELVARCEPAAVDAVAQRLRDFQGQGTRLAARGGSGGHSWCFP
ncbi:MAG: hypothetical protein F9K35_07420, partial [Burkholderiaceae bacterium]